MSVIDSVLAPNVIAGVYSRISPALHPLSAFWGWSGADQGRQSLDRSDGNAGSSMINDFGGRDFKYDYFDNTKTVAQGRKPGAVRGRTPPQKVGTVQGTFPRSAEDLELDLEQINNIRPIGEVSTGRDRMGRSYVNRQIDYTGQRISNVIELQTAAMMRGEYFFVQDGDELIQSFTDLGVTGSQKIDYKVPAGNKDQLDMLGDGDIIDLSWDAGTDLTNSANIPLHCFNINAAFVATHGYPLKHVFVTSVQWNNVVNNAFIKAQAGTAAKPLDAISQDENGLFVAILRAIPWLTWHVVDNGLDIKNFGAEGTTFTKSIEDNNASFLPDPNSQIAVYGNGSEPVVIKNTNSMSEEIGVFSWSFLNDNPASQVLANVVNGLPWLITPRAVTYGTVQF